MSDDMKFGFDLKSKEKQDLTGRSQVDGYDFTDYIMPRTSDLSRQEKTSSYDSGGPMADDGGLYDFGDIGDDGLLF